MAYRNVAGVALKQKFTHTLIHSCYPKSADVHVAHDVHISQFYGMIDLTYCITTFIAHETAPVAISNTAKPHLQHTSLIAYLTYCIRNPSPDLIPC